MIQVVSKQAKIVATDGVSGPNFQRRFWLCVFHFAILHTSNLRTCNDAELHVAFLGTPEGLQTQQRQCLKVIKYLKSNEKGKFRQNFLQGQISLSHYNPTPLHFTYKLVHNDSELHFRHNQEPFKANQIKSNFVLLE